MISQNHLLGALDVDTLEVLAPHLRRRRLRAGEAVADGDWVLFPESAVLSVTTPAAVSSASVGVIGAEGLAGWSPLVDVAPGTYYSVALFTDGDALAIAAPVLLSLAERSRRLRQMLLGFVGSFALQMTSTMVSNLRDPLERRLARWIAMLHDRVAGDALAITHSNLADALGVRRASVTDALHILEGERVLRCTRALIVVRDRAALEAAAGGAYLPLGGRDTPAGWAGGPRPHPAAADRVLFTLC